jgi:hypothetical protein
MPNERNTQAYRLIADLLKSTTPLGQYLKEGGPLTTLELESLTLTVASLKTFITVWKAQYGTK